MGDLTVIFGGGRMEGSFSPILALAYGPNFQPHPCAIVHYTRFGACLSCAAKLPDTFLIRPIDSEIERICRVVWRDEHLVGVEYVNVRTNHKRNERAAGNWGAIAGLYPT